MKLDPREIGVIDLEGETFLADLIAKACKKDPVKEQLSWKAVIDFGWNPHRLVNLYLAGVIEGHNVQVGDNISSGEWLCGVFASGAVLGNDHLQILMCFVNRRASIVALSTGKPYRSGKKTWSKAPAPLKALLNLLDDAVLKNSPVCVTLPTINPLEGKTLEDLDGKTIDEVRPHIRVAW